MKYRYAMLVLLAGIFFSASHVSGTESEPLVLSYDQSAEIWEEALPIGNGRLGAMVFGNPSRDRLQLNEDTVWAGEPGNNIPEGFLEVLPEVRELIFDKQYKVAESTLMEVLPRPLKEGNNYGMPYQNIGDLFLQFPGHENAISMERQLNLHEAVSSLKYTLDGVTYEREYFVSAVDQVIVVRLTADREHSITLSAWLESPQLHSAVHREDDQLVLSGRSGDWENKKGKVRFEARVLPLVEGGSVDFIDQRLHIKDANTVTLLLSIGSNFNHYDDLEGDEVERSKQPLLDAQRKSYSELIGDHIGDYQSYFDRVTFELGSNPDGGENTTDQRVVDFEQGQDLSLIPLYYQFGRYLLISSSRPGTQAANLQGIWNHHLAPPWDSKYTININLEMNYWPSEIANLAELQDPLFSLIKDLSETGQIAAKSMYDARGWVAHHNTDIWRIAGPVDGAFYGMWPMGGAWLIQHLWQHYLYSGDVAFLERIYPILKGAALFYSDVLQTEPEHQRLVVSPSMSPENRHPGGTSLGAGNTMDNQLVFDVFSNVIRAASILKVDDEFTAKLKEQVDQLPPMQIGKYGQLQEWMYDWDRVDDHHRHISHLYGLFPSDQISPFRTPELFVAAKNSLEYRGDESTGWSMGWKVNWWARLLNGNRAFKLIKEQLSPATNDQHSEKGGTYPNLFDAHPPFQIDGNFGCTAGITEMLLQSYDGYIFLLPALPDEWNSGTIRGIRARGGFTFDMVWEDSHLKELVVHSAIGGNCRVRSWDQLASETTLVPVEDGTPNPNPLYHVNDVAFPEVSKDIVLPPLKLPQSYLYDFETRAGEVYRISVAK